MIPYSARLDGMLKACARKWHYAVQVAQAGKPDIGKVASDVYVAARAKSLTEVTAGFVSEAFRKIVSGIEVDVAAMIEARLATVGTQVNPDQRLILIQGEELPSAETLISDCKDRLEALAQEDWGGWPKASPLLLAQRYKQRVLFSGPKTFEACGATIRIDPDLVLRSLADNMSLVFFDIDKPEADRHTAYAVWTLSVRYNTAVTVNSSTVSRTNTPRASTSRSVMDPLYKYVQSIKRRGSDFERNAGQHCDTCQFKLVCEE